MIVSTLALYACGGGGDSGPEDANANSAPVVLVGVIVDSAVGGLHYATPSNSGTTNAMGEFNYVSGEAVTFSVGDAEFPAVTAVNTITPLTIFNTSEVSDTSVVNMARLLQTLDDDGDPDNGINILSAAHDAASGLTIDFESPTFDSQVANLVAGSGSVTTTLISAEQAKDHLTETLAALNPDIPEKFSVAYLSGKTFYDVWFGEGTDASGDTLDHDVPIVYKLEFGTNGEVRGTGILNDTTDGELTFSYNVNEAGLLYFDGEETEGFQIVCGSTSQYIKTHYLWGGEFDGVDLFFFNESEALAYANNLTAPISPCSSASGIE